MDYREPEVKRNRVESPRIFRAENNAHETTSGLSKEQPVENQHSVRRNSHQHAGKVELERPSHGNSFDTLLLWRFSFLSRGLGVLNRLAKTLVICFVIRQWIANIEVHRSHPC